MGPVKPTETRKRSSSSPYHAFFQAELKRLKQENPSMTHKAAFKQAGLNWRTSPLNPKSQKSGTGAALDAPTAAPPPEPTSCPSAQAPPDEPAVAVAPSVPVVPADPVVPEAPVVPTDPVVSADPAVPEAPVVPEAPAPATAVSGIPASAAAPSAEPPSLYSVHAGADTQQVRAEVPAGEQPAAGHGAPVKMMPSMVAHSVGGALTAAK